MTAEIAELPEPVRLALAKAADMDAASRQLQQDLMYPVGPPNPEAPAGNVMLLHLMHPDAVITIVYHLIRCGWRKDPDQAMVKQIPVVGSQFADLVKYVPVESPDEAMHVDRPKPDESWSVRPTVNVIDEVRPND